ncbi:nitrogenase component 1 [Rubrobacter aplysinae]|uniref:nitrogenase component 1 n=1 Tax=Rubrobacter aplysinae TaxID=909625 RepID=UPI00064C1A2D|nr:nitrogenase component 1 [Rubrobacter aplysinae]
MTQRNQKSQGNQRSQRTQNSPVKLLSGVHEGPGSHGMLRVSAGIRGVHTILRAMPEEWYLPALLATKGESSGTEPAPVSLSPLHRGPRPEGSRAPGDTRSDITSAVRRNPRAEAFVFARSETALLSGEKPPKFELPEDEETGWSPRLVTCPWETARMREHEAADLVLEELVRAYARPLKRSESPSVNIFGPPMFGPNARAEMDEAARLLEKIGVEVNARLPLGAGVEDLKRLPRAWANLVLYREVGDSATLYLRDEFGIPRVTTPMIGAAGTGSVLRSVGSLCSLDPRQVQRATFSELSQTARLPWYARLASPETFAGRRVAIFGDFTYAVGLGYVLAREVGLEIAPCGTYMEHLRQDFLFQASSFTDEAFATDDPEEAAARIEGARPDLVIGTHLEEKVAESLGVPFLPLVPPTAHESLVEQPLMGYAGSSILADHLRGALRKVPRDTVQGEDGPGVPWTEGALEELENISPFLRGRARRMAEERARERGSAEVTRRILRESRS